MPQPNLIRGMPVVEPKIAWHQMTLSYFLAVMKKYDPSTTVFVAVIDGDTGHGFPMGSGYEEKVTVHFPNWRDESMDRDS